MRFVCPDGEPQYRPLLDRELLAQLEADGHELVWHDAAPETPEEWSERIRGADGMLVLWRVPPGVIRATPTLRVISFVGTGVEMYLEIDEVRAGGITLSNVPSYGSNAIAEHAVALLFAVARRITERDQAVRAGSWAQDEALELRGRRLGVVGAGPIGTRMIELGQALGMTVVCWTRTRTPERERELGVPLVELDELFSTSDVVSLHLAVTPETEGIVDRRLLGLLPPHAIVINTARGALLDEHALAELLEAGKVGGAGVDVLGVEPPPPTHPLLNAPRVVITPHVAYHTAEASRELLRISLENLVAYARGEPQNVR
jgi:phosphoglycerate dehydrogenase-like enzyme